MQLPLQLPTSANIADVAQMLHHQHHKQMIMAAPSTRAAFEKFKINDENSGEVVAILIDLSTPAGCDLAEALWGTEAIARSLAGQKQDGKKNLVIGRGFVPLQACLQILGADTGGRLDYIKSHYEEPHDTPLALVLSKGHASVWSIDGDFLK